MSELPYKAIPTDIAGVKIPPELRLEARPEDVMGGRYLVNTRPVGGIRDVPPGPPTGMFTRNLIGSLAASASRLTDPSDRIGIWFILQDLSVRTEGDFRYFLPPLNRYFMHC
jgi:hypothetical protein